MVPWFLRDEQDGHDDIVSIRGHSDSDHSGSCYGDDDYYCNPAMIIVQNVVIVIIIPILAAILIAAFFFMILTTSYHAAFYLPFLLISMLSLLFLL